MLKNNSSPPTWYQYVPYLQQDKKQEEDINTVDVTSIINSQHRIYKHNMGIRETISSVSKTNVADNRDTGSTGYESVRNLQQIIDDIRFLANGTEKQQLPCSIGTPLYGLPKYCEYLQNNFYYCDDYSRKCLKKKKRKDVSLIHKNRTVVR